MVKITNQGKNGCLSRKMQPTFPLENKSLVKSPLFTEENNKSSLFYHDTIQVYRYIYNNIRVCVIHVVLKLHSAEGSTTKKLSGRWLKC